MAGKIYTVAQQKGGAGKTTLAGKLAAWFKAEGHSPMLAACDLQRPNAVNQLQIVGERAGVHVFAPEPGNGVGDPVKVSRDGVAPHRVVVDHHESRGGGGTVGSHVPILSRWPSARCLNAAA